MPAKPKTKKSKWLKQILVALAFGLILTAGSFLIAQKALDSSIAPAHGWPSQYYVGGSEGCYVGHLDCTDVPNYPQLDHGAIISDLIFWSLITWITIAIAKSVKNNTRRSDG